MSSKREEGIEDFWRLIARLKNERRRGWKQKLGLKGPESVADHSFAVSMLCLVEAGRRGGYDLERVLKLSLIHDLDEAITGDLTPEDKKKMGAAKVGRERERAREIILGRLPGIVRVEWRGLWTDLSRKQSREARLVKDLDLVEMALQAREYEKMSGVKRDDVREFYRSALKGIADPELRRIVESAEERGGRVRR